MKGIKEHSL